MNLPVTRIRLWQVVSPIPIVCVEGEYPESREPLDQGGVVAASADGGQLRRIQLQPLLPYLGQRLGEVLVVVVKHTGTVICSSNTFCSPHSCLPIACIQLKCTAQFPIQVDIPFLTQVYIISSFPPPSSVYPHSQFKCTIPFQ